MIRGALLSAAMGFLGAQCALADPLSGRWAFRTDIAEKGCTISGTMMIQPALGESAVRQCSFVSSETCGPSDPQPTRMEQSCRVIEQGEFILIRSEVTGSLTEGVEVDFYLPDHFTVEVESASRMAGTWYDRLYRDTVEFWRPDDVPVS